MPDRTAVTPAGIPHHPDLPPGMKVGSFLFISGQVATDVFNMGNVVGGNDFEAQARKAVSNLRAIIEAGGATMQDVAKITTFILNVDDYPAWAKVRAESWPDDPPASSTVVVRDLVGKHVGAPGLLIEIEAIVRVPD